MSHTPRHWKPETRPQDCWDWITPEDVCRHALAAFYLAREACKHPPGRRFAEADGGSWSDREAFGDNLALLFEMRVKTEGYQLGVVPHWAEDAKMLQKWTAPPSWAPEELLHPEQQAEATTAHRGDGAQPHGSEAKQGPAHPSGGPGGPPADAVRRRQFTSGEPCAP